MQQATPCHYETLATTLATERHENSNCRLIYNAPAAPFIGFLSYRFSNLLVLLHLQCTSSFGMSFAILYSPLCLGRADKVLKAETNIISVLNRLEIYAEMAYLADDRVHISVGEINTRCVFTT